MNLIPFSLWTNSSASLMACVAERDGGFQVVLWDPASGAVSWLTDGEGDRDHPTRSPDGSRLVWVHGQGPVNWLEVVDRSSGRVQSYQVESGVHAYPRFTYYERSPFFFLDHIRAPGQLICGANDPRCPAQESIQARDALQAMGKEWDFVLYLDEGHSFLKTGNVVDAKRRRVEFLARFLE